MGCSAGLGGKGQIIPVSAQPYPFSSSIGPMEGSSHSVCPGTMFRLSSDYIFMNFEYLFHISIHFCLVPWYTLGQIISGSSPSTNITQ